MAFTPEQKRERRANASQEERDRHRDRKRSRRQDESFARQESESRKIWRCNVMEAARAGDSNANAILDGAVQRARKRRDRVRFFASRRPGQRHIELRTKFFTNHVAAKALLQRRAEKQRARRNRQPAIDARRAASQRARELKAAAVTRAAEEFRQADRILSAVSRRWRELDASLRSERFTLSGAEYNRLPLVAAQWAAQEAAWADAKRAREAWREARRRPLSSFTVDDADGWCCDVAGLGCIKPNLASPEPVGVHTIWVCDECNWCVCSSCHNPAESQHPHALDRLTTDTWSDAVIPCATCDDGCEPTVLV